MSRRRSRRLRVALAATPLTAMLALSSACSEPADEAPAADEASWSVTAWGEEFEVFPEVGPLVVDSPVLAHTHVTRLQDFSPLREGRVEVVLVSGADEQVFSADSPTRPGIFSIEVEPGSVGTFDLLFRIGTPETAEEIRGGTVRVGPPEDPGRPAVAPAPRGATDGGEPLPFLKEEQWRSDFGTAWVRQGRMAVAASGLASVGAPAGGDVVVTAPVDGVLWAPGGEGSWPFRGRSVERGEPLVRIAPQIAQERSLANLDAELASLDAELAAAAARQQRLQELLALDATSRREVAENDARVASLKARRESARRDLQAARSARGGGIADAFQVRSPFAGAVAALQATAGATVKAGDPILRLVRTDRVWLETFLEPGDARRLAREGVTGVVLTAPNEPSIRLEEGVRLISVAPTVDPDTGTLSLILELPAADSMIPGTRIDVEVLSGAYREGVVVPASALIDDGGVDVVYLQLSGERFARQQVDVRERQGDMILVDGLVPGQRLVTAGGAAIRRSSLMSSGEAHGHVH